MSCQNKVIAFQSEGYRLKGLLCYPKGKKISPGVLFIHGGGRYVKNHYLDWQGYLCAHGIASFAYFSRGVGESEGIFKEGSLENRVIDAISAYRVFAGSGKVDDGRICVSGSSMGAHVALKMLEKIPTIKALILQSAAAYSKQAFRVPFNFRFSQLIRKKKSWDSTDIFAILDKFQGEVMVVYGEKDRVIPMALQSKYQKRASKRFLISFNDIGHRILQPESQAEAIARKELFRRSAQFLKSIK